MADEVATGSFPTQRPRGSAVDVTAERGAEGPAALPVRCDTRFQDSVPWRNEGSRTGWPRNGVATSPVANLRRKLTCGGCEVHQCIFVYQRVAWHQWAADTESTASRIQGSSRRSPITMGRTHHTERSSNGPSID